MINNFCKKDPYHSRNILTKLHKCISLFFDCIEIELESYMVCYQQIELKQNL